MLTMLAYYPGDAVTALNLFKWIQELGGCANHDLVLINDPRCQKNDVAGILDAAKAVFKTVHPYEAKQEIDGWPQGANYFFRYGATLGSYQVNLKHFLWLEPDVVPMKAGWLDAIEKEYLACGRPFLGDRVEVRLEGKEVPLHMSGVGVYPSPIANFAGETLRCFDEAWDMAARHQIVPKAYFTELIEHAWRHPVFTNSSELTTQIAPQTVLFHSSKDGSLIRLLRGASAPEQRTPGAGPPFQAGAGRRDLRGAQPLTAVSMRNEPPEGKRDIPLSSERKAEPGSEVGIRGGSQPICDIFIRTYEKDYEWLYWCIRSIDKFCTGFHNILVVSPQQTPKWMELRLNQNLHSGIPVKWMSCQDETPDGYLAQQITKLHADGRTDADFILHVDSDLVFNRPCSPADFLAGDKVIWYYTPYEVLKSSPEIVAMGWERITGKFMGTPVMHEFMRRLPMMMPRWLYARLREFCEIRHRMSISDYIKAQPQWQFSEFNVLGMYAFAYQTAEFAWIDTASVYQMPAPFARQYRCHTAGDTSRDVTPQIKAEIESFLGNGNLGSPPNPADAARQQDHVAEVNAVPQNIPRIKELPSGIWVLDGDQISGWVEECGHLDHDQYFLPIILRQIKPGDTVIDVGAFIGDHTISYATAVGAHGRVLAFEPNKKAVECLLHNLDVMNLCNVSVFERALGNSVRKVPLSGNNYNWGGSYIGEHMSIGEVQEVTLDQYQFIKVNLIKIDVEGYELYALAGAEKTINRCKPKLVIEVNQGALARQGTTPNDIYNWIERHGYTWSIMQENAKTNDPMYDILCVPVEKPAEAHPPESNYVNAAVDSPPQVILSLNDHIEALASYANQGQPQRKYLRKQLRKHGVIPPGKAFPAKNSGSKRVSKVVQPS